MKALQENPKKMFIRPVKSEVIQAVMLGALILLAGCVSEPRAPRQTAVPQQKEVPPPRVITLITEQGAGTSTSSAELDGVAVPMLMARKIPAVDPSVVQSNLKRIQTILTQSGEEQGAAEVGLQFGADVILNGHAEARCLASQIAGSNLKSYQGTVNLRAICTDDANILAMASETASIIALDDATGSMKAIQAAGRKALDKVVPEMLVAWNKRSAGNCEKAAKSLSVSEALEPTSTLEPDIVIEPPPAGYQPTVMALLPLTAQGGVSSNSIPIITDTLYATLLKSQWFRLVTREDMAKILTEHKLQMSDICDSSARVVEFGKILNAEKMLIGTVSKLGTTYQVVLKLVNVETGEIEKAGQAEASGNVKVLMQLVKKAAADLLKQAGKQEPSTTAKAAGDATDQKQGAGK